VTYAADVAEGEVDTPTPYYDTMFAAKCILKQRSKRVLGLMDGTRRRGHMDKKGRFIRRLALALVVHTY